MSKPVFEIDDVVRLKWDDNESNSAAVGKDLTVIMVLTAMPPRWLVTHDGEGREYVVRGDDCIKVNQDGTLEKPATTKMFYVIYDSSQDAYVADARLGGDYGWTKDLNLAFLHDDEQKRDAEIFEDESWVTVERRLSVVG